MVIPEDARSRITWNLPALRWLAQSCRNLATITPTLTMVTNITVDPVRSIVLRPRRSMRNCSILSSETNSTYRSFLHYIPLQELC